MYPRQVIRFFAFFLFIFLAACATLTPKEVITSPGLLWLIEKPGVQPSYIFGTIHSEDPRVTTIPDRVYSAFSAADSVAFEILLDSKSSQEAARAMFFTDGRELKSVVDRKTYSQAVDAMKHNKIDEGIVNMMKPWAIFVTLNLPVQKTGLFLDVILFNEAKKKNKELIGLEEIMEQVDALAGMSDADQIVLLKSTLQEYKKNSDFMDKLLDVYLSRDLEKILTLYEKYQLTIEPRVAKIFNQRILIARNYRMLGRMQILLEKGNSFVAVGALHLPGDEGILNLLRLQHYQVTSVY